MSQKPEDVAFDKACSYLTYRPRTENEILRFLCKHEYDEVQDAVMNRLRRAGFVDDEAFSRMWITERTSTKGYGPRRLRAELLRLGVPAASIEEALSSAYPTDSKSTMLARMARLKWHKLSDQDPRAKARKLYSYLIRLGFASSEVSEVVELIVRTENEQATDEP